MSGRRFSCGEPFATTEEAVKAILAGEWVMMKVMSSSRPKHPGFMVSMNLKTIGFEDPVSDEESEGSDD